MILDYLISKYIDGDLSPEEDSRLRELVAADPLARDAFEEAALLHVAMATDAVPDVPAAVDIETRALIASRMAAGPGASVPPSSQQQGKGMRVALRVLTMAMLLVAALPFGDMALLPVLPWQRGNAEVAMLDVAAPNQENGKAARPTSAHTRGASGDVSAGTQEDAEYPGDLAGSAEVITNSTDVAEALEAIADQAHTSDLARRSVTREVDLGEMPAVAEQQPVSVAAMSALMGQQPADGIEPMMLRSLPAKISTMYGVGRASGGPIGSNVEQVSFNIGYGIDDATFIGIEIGSVRYDVATTHRATVGGLNGSDVTPEQPSVSLAPSGLPTDHSGTKVASTNRTGQLAVSEYQSLQSVQSMWGAIGIRRDVLSAGGASLAVGAGVGISENGPVGYGRVSIRYDVWRGTMVHLGGQHQWMALGTGTAVPMTRIMSMTFGVGLSL
jgi:hypothetical protein